VSIPSSEAKTFWHFIVSSVKRILECLDALSEEDLNWRPLESANSLYALATHTMGNVEENLLGVLCGQAVNRQREAEFTIRGHSLKHLHSEWGELQKRIDSALDQLSVTELDQLRNHPRRGQLTGRAVMIIVARHAAEHMGHAQLTRDLLFAARGKILPPRDY
jgi:uncharacterized damage-inducible protein DinB